MEERSRSPFVRTIFFCCNERDPGEAACANRGARDLQAQLKQYVKDHGLKQKVRVMRSSCMDLCASGPNVCIQPDNVWYAHVQREDLQSIIDRWITPLEESDS